MNLNGLKPCGILSPFKHFCVSIGELPSAYMNSMSYYEMLDWFCKFLEEKVIPAVNKNAEATKELQEKYIELKNYVDNYFGNLDVQEEINNKLDEMVTDGTLANIINNEIFENINNDIKNIKKKLYYVNVVENNIENDGTDVTEKLQNLINSYDEGTTFFFENGNYYFKNISLKSNSKILGNTNTKFIIPTNEEIACNFNLENVENISFENIYLQNAENSNVGAQFGDNINHKACIYTNNCNNISLINCIFNNFFYGLFAENTNNIICNKCEMKNSGYAMILILNSSKNITITNCLFDTAFSNNQYNNTYLVAFSSSGYNENNGIPEFITIENCIFKNNPYWEGVDTHGCNNILINNCKFYNCMFSIRLFNDQRYTIRNLKMHDIIITNCYIDTENLLNAMPIYISGIASGLVNGYMIKNITIENNTIITNKNQNTNIPCIRLLYCENLNFNKNKIVSTQTSVRLDYVIKSNINENHFGYSKGFAILTEYCYLINMNYNSCISLDPTIENAINTAGLSLIFPKENFSNCSGVFNRNYGRSNRNVCFGKPVIDWLTMMPRNEIITNKNVSYNQTTPSDDMEIQLSGEYMTDIVTASDNILKECSLFQNIRIKNAGENGEDLDCYILEYIDFYHFKISKPIMNSFTNTTYQLLPKTSVQS